MSIGHLILIGQRLLDPKSKYLNIINRDIFLVVGTSKLLNKAEGWVNN